MITRPAQIKNYIQNIGTRTIVCNVGRFHVCGISGLSDRPLVCLLNEVGLDSLDDEQK
jgi:hypothetical protein